MAYYKTSFFLISYVRLIFSFTTVDDFGEELHTTEPDSLTFKIETNKFPTSPVQAGSFLPGQEVEFLVEFEQYPDPKPENVVWVVQGLAGEKQEFKPGIFFNFDDDF